MFDIKNSSEDDYADLAEINIIPLVDIMLVLLIVFMVAAPLSLGGIGVNLPNTKAKGQAIDQSRIVLSIDKNGEYYIDKAKIPSGGLADKMTAIFSMRDKKEIYIRADKGVIYEKVIDAMAAAKMAGVQKMSMLTQNDTKKI